jgi:hypothetical protein
MRRGKGAVADVVLVERLDVASYVSTTKGKVGAGACEGME